MTETNEDIVRVHREGAIGVLTLNNPRRLNAFGLAMRRQMWERLLELESDASCRAIVLTGAGGNLCSGGDITEMAQRPIIEGRMRMELSTRIFRLLVTGPKPFLCAIEGNAAGCGVSLVAASDYSAAASDSRYRISFIKMGLLPDVGGLWSIPRRIGHRKTMEFAAFAEPFDAQEALRLTLVNELCEPGKALERALIAAEKFAQHPPLAVALLRNALNVGSDSIDAACQSEMSFQSTLQNSADFAEAARAFLEKRAPVFTGR